MPPSWHPYIKALYSRVDVRLQAITTRRRVHRAYRVIFLSPEIADLEPYEYLSPGPDEVLVDVAYNAVSTGTEVAQLLGIMPKGFPYWPGYSGSGIVSMIGKKVEGIKVGDRVAGQFKHARQLVVKADKVFVLPLEIQLEEAAFIEIGIIVLQGIRKAMIRPGEEVMVIGQGIIGQMASRLARIAGACPVVAVASSSRRKAVALAPGGADYFLLSGAVEDNVADVVIEASGATGALSTALTAAKPRGRVVLLGSSRSLERDIHVKKYIQDKSLRIIGAHVSVMPKNDFSRGMWTYRQEGTLFVDLLHSQMLSIHPMITHKYSPKQANTLYENLYRGKLSPVGVLLDWSDVPLTING